MRVVQEFYCSGCQGYFRVTLNMALNLRVIVECPKCQRQHERDIQNGEIRDASKQYKTTTVVVSMPSTWSATSVLRSSKPYMRNGVVVNDPTRDLIDDRWNELYGDRV